MKLYTCPFTRGSTVEWYLKELGRDDVEQVIVDIRKDQQKDPEYLKVNPFGKVPALEDGEVKVFETGAVLLYLADKFGQLKTPEQRATVNKWVVYANASLSGLFYEDQRKQGIEAALLAPLNKVLADREYLEGGELSVADIAVGSFFIYLSMVTPQVDLTQYPNINSYIHRLKARPACADTILAAATHHAPATQPPPEAESAVPEVPAYNS
eukprot:GHRR01001315.1.p1 GENE.GHRR01001315.1~~GHRR01001315.1.p1  ORF type:complete len:211 (+),score=33.81 GHRR01001315.1:203-835(+)